MSASSPPSTASLAELGARGRVASSPRWVSPPSSCLRTSRLADGELLTVRSIRPSDLGRLRTAFDALSQESRYQRFHAHVAELPAASWRYLTEVDGRDHVALVAQVADRIVGVARFIRLQKRSDRAEVAFVVADDFQRRGVGRVLLAALVEQAVSRGVRAFVAAVLSDNLGIRRLLASPPLTPLSDRGDRLVVELPHELMPGPP